MKTTLIIRKALKFENGDILIAIDKTHDAYFVETSYGIMNYNSDEMKEIYNFNKFDYNL
jgi:hypothetical protein